jgi:hypothetical protein
MQYAMDHQRNYTLARQPLKQNKFRRFQKKEIAPLIRSTKSKLMQFATKSVAKYIGR